MAETTEVVRLSANDLDTIAYGLQLYATIADQAHDERLRVLIIDTLRKLGDARAAGATLELAPFSESVPDFLKGRG